MDDILLPTVEIPWPEDPVVPGGMGDVLGSQSPFPTGTVGVIGRGSDAAGVIQVATNTPAASYYHSFFGAVQAAVAAQSSGISYAPGATPVDPRFSTPPAPAQGYKFGVAPAASQKPAQTAPRTREARRTYSVSPTVSPSPFKLQTLPPEDFGLSQSYNDYSDSTVRDWINTLGLYGPVSVPIAVVAPVNQDAIDFLGGAQRLYGLTFEAPGRLFDRGVTPRSNFKDEIIDHTGFFPDQ